MPSHDNETAKERMRRSRRRQRAQEGRILTRELGPFYFHPQTPPAPLRGAAANSAAAAAINMEVRDPDPPRAGGGGEVEGWIEEPLFPVPNPDPQQEREGGGDDEWMDESLFHMLGGVNIFDEEDGGGGEDGVEEGVAEANIGEYDPDDGGVSHLRLTKDREYARFCEYSHGFSDDDTTLLEIGTFFLYMTARGRMSKSVSEDVFRLMFQMAEAICHLKRARIPIRSASWGMKLALGKLKLPPLVTDVYELNEDGEEQLLDTVSVLRRDLQGTNVTKRVTRYRLSHLVRYIYFKHGVPWETPPIEWRALEVSTDGVDPSEKSAWAYHCTAISFPACGIAYPVYIHMFNKDRGSKLDTNEVYELFIKELMEMPRLILSRCIADSKERKMIKGMVGTNGREGCDYCYVEGRKVGVAKNISFIVDHDAPPALRTNEEIRDAAEEAERTGEDVRGVRRKTPLMRLRYFDLTKKSPPDPMHNQFLGIIKKIHFTFYKGKRKKKGIRRRRRSGEKERRTFFCRKFDRMLSKCKVPSEHGRRTRQVHTQNSKAIEWYFIGLFANINAGAFVLRTEKMERRRILCLVSFLIRALSLEDSELELLEGAMGDLSAIFRLLETLYLQELGPSEFTYNGCSGV